LLSELSVLPSLEVGPYSLLIVDPAVASKWTLLRNS
jgi:hypothetical protein